MKRIRIILALLATLAWAASSVEVAPTMAAPAGVAQAKIAISARGGFGDDGSYLIGKWFPVRVTLTNPAGGASRRVRLEVDSQGDSASVVTGTYVREIDMPAPSRKVVTLYATAANFARNVEVRLMEGTTQIDRATVKLDPLEQATNIIIGVVSPDPALLNLLKGERFGHVENALSSSGYQSYLPPVPTTAPTSSSSSSSSSSPAQAAVAHMTLEEIPTIAEALDGLGVLVLDDTDTGSLQVEQKQALADWVAGGGTLIAAVKPGGEGTLAGLSELSPVEVNSTKNLLGIDRLADWVAVQEPASSSTLVPAATIKEDARSTVFSPVSQEGVPLIAIREVGRGQVIYMALSPGLAPLKNWDGTLPLFRRLLVEHKLRVGDSMSAPGYYGYPSNKVFETYGNIFDLPGLDLPSPALIGIFLFIYIAIIGPVNFIILRRMRRTELAWATIPALVALFSIIAYLLAFQSKGGDLVALRTNVVETYATQGRGEVTQYLGLFSPTRGTYNLEGSSPSLVTEIDSYGYGGASSGNPLRFSSDGTTIVSDIKVNTWSLRGFQASSMIDAESPLLALLYVRDDMLEGTIRNRSAQPLQDVVLIRGDALQHFTSIAPGESVDVKLKISSRPFKYNSPTVLMPTPPGVSDPTLQGNFGNNNSSNSDAQRAYNRKVEVLNRALYPVLSSDPPNSFEVLALMWGPPAGSDLSVTDATARNDDLNLWLSRIPVTTQNDTGTLQAQLSAGMVPFTVYAPGNSADWISGPPVSVPNLTLKPYADITYKLPAGTKPATIAFSYQAVGNTGEIELLAHNVNTGNWDRVGTLVNGAISPPQLLPISNPSAYTSPNGHVILRLNTRPGEQSVNLSPMDLVLNGAK
ncbi:MAG: hypothetical protein ABIO92_10835 [Chloroflexia bacterium]